MSQPQEPSDKVEEPQDTLAADAASLQTPAAFAQFLSSRLSKKDKARYVSEFAGPQDRMKAMSPAAHEEHLLRIKEMVAESERMGHGILGAEVFSVIKNRSEEQPSSKRRKLSRAEADAARGLQDDKEETKTEFDSQQIRLVSQSVENPAMDAAVHAQAESPDQDDAESTEVRPKGNSERRRAQMREAQRNYRARRETTIATLESRNKHLEQVIAGMSAAFQSMQDALSQSESTQQPVELPPKAKAAVSEFMSWSDKARQPDTAPKDDG